MLLVRFFSLRAGVSPEWSVQPLLFLRRGSSKSDNSLKVDGTSFPDAGSLVTTAHLAREICPRDLKYRKSKTNLGAQKLLHTRCFFFLSVRDWI